MIFGIAIIKCRHCSFKNIPDSLVDWRTLNCARDVLHTILMFLIEVGIDDLLGITYHSQIRIVRDNDYLPALLSGLHTRHEQFVHGLIIKVLFRLVYHEWHVVFVDE